MKNIAALAVFLMLASWASAYADSYVTVNDLNGASTLCLSLDNLDHPACGNQTLKVDATSDHTVYIMPNSQISESSSNTDKFTYFFMTPIALFAGGAAFLIFMILFTGAIFYVLTGTKKRRYGG
jgi:hypothetical protein